MRLEPANRHAAEISRRANIKKRVPASAIRRWFEKIGFMEWNSKLSNARRNKETGYYPKMGVNGHAGSDRAFRPKVDNPARVPQDFPTRKQPHKQPIMRATWP